MDIKMVNVLKIRRLLDEYKSGKKLYDIDINMNSDELDSTIKYLINIDYFDNYELNLLGSLNTLCADKLRENSQYITDERILCIFDRNILLNTIHTRKKFTDDISEIVDMLNKQSVLVNRRDVEYNKYATQLIPYMIVRINNKIVLLRKKKGDSRLINYIDFPAGHCSSPTIKESIFTELNEELGIEPEDIKEDIKYLDFIPPTEDIFSVSYYHLGIICEIILRDNCKVINKESHKHEIIYYDLDKDFDNILDIKCLSEWCTYGLLTYLKYYL